MSDASMLQPTRAAYYPHVAFCSTAWVKNALLYWEGLVRARPPGSSPNDDQEIQELIAAGLIEELAPEPIRQQLMPHLGRRLEDLIRCRGGRLPASIPGIRRIRGAGAGWEEHDRAEFLESLRGFPLAQKAFRETPEVARALLFMFGADTIAREHRFAPVTDDPTFAAISEYFDHNEVTDDPGRANSPDWDQISLLCLPTPSLEAIAQLSVERLLEIRKKYAAQRRHFRQTVQARVSEVVQLQTREAMVEHLKALREEIRGDFEATWDAVKDAKVKERWSLLAIGAPMSTSIGAAVASGAPAAIVTIEGIGVLALGVTRWFTQKRLTAAGPESPYLLSLQTALQRPPWERLGHALKELVHG